LRAAEDASATPRANEEEEMYPVTYAADYQGDDRNRLTTFLRYIVAIPWFIVAGLWAIAAEIAAIIAWFSIVFTGRYPRGAYDFVGKFVRMYSRVNGFYLLATDEFPPFNGDPSESYPIRIGIPDPKPEYDRLKTGLRLIIGIPVLLLAYVQALIATVVALIAWFAILFTGRLSEGLFNPLRSALAYSTRATAYFLLLTEDYPPFSYEPSAEQPQLASSQGPSLEPPAGQPAEAERREP
jgi:hypothetical protein